MPTIEAIALAASAWFLWCVGMFRQMKPDQEAMGLAMRLVVVLALMLTIASHPNGMGLPALSLLGAVFVTPLLWLAGRQRPLPAVA